MSQEERYNTRDRSYSAWHRRLSTRRFIGIEKAQTLAMIDMDASVWVEYDDNDKQPLALVETAVDVGQDWKTATITRNLAKMAGIPAFVLLYKLSKDQNPVAPGFMDIESFRVKMLWPKPCDKWRALSPQQWADALCRIRQRQCNILDAQDNPCQPSQVVV